MSAVMESSAMVSKPETVKDSVQVIVESGASRVGSIAMIITGAVRDVAKEIGGFATDVFEMLEASKRAQADESRRSPADDERP